MVCLGALDLMDPTVLEVAVQVHQVHQDHQVHQVHQVHLGLEVTTPANSQGMAALVGVARHLDVGNPLVVETGLAVVAHDAVGGL